MTDTTRLEELRKADWERICAWAAAQYERAQAEALFAAMKAYPKSAEFST